ncbi:capsid assembly protein [Aquabacterium sp.]|uniref:capsid assembly protein n=1 Tax=Aquabacterium sp. TaxID=1872578 RepID=UPI004037F849
MDQAQTPVPGSPEHAAAMVALAEAEGVQIRTLDSQGRTVTQEDIQTDVPVNEPEAPQETQQTTEQSQTDSPFKEFYTEFAEKGDISEASKTKLLELTRSKGLDDALVEAYIDGQKALKGAQTTQEQAAALEANKLEVARNESYKAGITAAGGEDAYKQMTAWARTNLSDAELKAFNAQVEVSKEAAMLAIDGLKSRWTRATGQVPGRTLSGGAAGDGSGITAFSSQEDVETAMSDKRYANDPKFRAQVAKRLALTDASVMGIRIR